MMMLSICSSAVLLLLSAVPPFAHGSVSSCFSDLTDLQAAVDTKDPDTVVTYTLCPNTEYPIGVFAPPDFDEIVDGQSPLFLRKNSIIKCGDNGKDNGCILSGGIFQAHVTTPSFDNEEKTNIVIKGLTFQGGINAGYLDAAAGDVTFVDCVIKVYFLVVDTRAHPAAFSNTGAFIHISFSSLTGSIQLWSSVAFVLHSS